jgi:hypothetical protein
MEIRLEGTNKSIELKSCKAGELETIWNQALRYMQATDEASCNEIAAEIVERWVPTLNSAGDLTVDDIWAILMAKVGKAKAPTLSRLPELAAEAVRFLGEKGMEPLIATMEKSILEETGEDTSQD